MTSSPHSGLRLGRIGLLLLLTHCSASGGDIDAAVAERSSELVAGLQVMGQFTSSGAMVPGSVASTADTVVSATRSGPGHYTVRFEGIAPTLPVGPGLGGNIQVSATGQGNVRCNLSASWVYSGVSIFATVYCHAPQGVDTDSGFYVEYSRNGSGNGGYAVVSSLASIASATSYNTTGSANTVSHGGTGVYHVFLPGPLAMQQGSIEVTAFGPATYCHPGLRDYISSEIVTVSCFNDGGMNHDTPFALIYSGSPSVSMFGMGAFTQVSASGVLNPTYSWKSCTGATTSTRIGVGRYRVTHPKVGLGPLGVQVNAFSGASNYCKPEAVQISGTTATVIVACYSATGSPIDSPFVETLAGTLTAGSCPP